MILPPIKIKREQLKKHFLETIKEVSLLRIFISYFGVAFISANILVLKNPTIKEKDVDPIIFIAFITLVTIIIELETASAKVKRKTNKNS